MAKQLVSEIPRNTRTIIPVARFVSCSSVTRPSSAIQFGENRMRFPLMVVRLSLHSGNPGNHQTYVRHVFGYACREAMDIVIAEKLTDLTNETLASGEAPFTLVVALRHHAQVQETMAVDARRCADRRCGQGDKNGTGKTGRPAVKTKCIRHFIHPSRRQAAGGGPVSNRPRHRLATEIYINRFISV